MMLKWMVDEDDPFGCLVYNVLIVMLALTIAGCLVILRV